MTDQTVPTGVDTTRRSPLSVYFGRMRGSRRTLSQQRKLSAVPLTFLAAFLGIYLISIPALFPSWPMSTKLFLVGSFGATALLLYAAPRVEFAQPRNVVAGQVISATVGVTAYKLLGAHLGLAAALAVAASVCVMQVTRTVHPPAGATALIAVLGPAPVHRLGYTFILTPVLFGIVILIVVAVLVNNLSPDEARHYPVTWW
ncbi:MAG TPA: HPP family protein [Acidimicrobiales bacterium]|nr:HPP family protein [Acidimicrobiales bacterium]